MSREYRSSPAPVPVHEEEPLETEPEMIVDFYFGKHGEAADIEDMRDIFQASDAYVVEKYGYDIDGTDIQSRFGREIDR